MTNRYTAEQALVEIDDVLKQYLAPIGISKAEALDQIGPIVNRYFVLRASHSRTETPELAAALRSCGESFASMGVHFDALPPIDESEQLTTLPRVSEPMANYGLNPAQLAELLAAALKPEEIEGSPDVQHVRVAELIQWFWRFRNGNANPKWLVAHAFELAYFIASKGMNRHIDLIAITRNAYLDGVTITAQDRAALEKLGLVGAADMAAPINGTTMPPKLTNENRCAAPLAAEEFRKGMPVVSYAQFGPDGQLENARIHYEDRAFDVVSAKDAGIGAARQSHSGMKGNHAPIAVDHVEGEAQ